MHRWIQFTPWRRIEHSEETSIIFDFEQCAVCHYCHSILADISYVSQEKLWQPYLWFTSNFLMADICMQFWRQLNWVGHHIRCFHFFFWLFNFVLIAVNLIAATLNCQQPLYTIHWISYYKNVIQHLFLGLQCHFMNTRAEVILCF